MKLGLKHLAPYLPYGLSFSVNLNDVRDNFPDELRTLKLAETNIDLALKTGKPILRPLSSITIEEAYELGVIITSEADMEDMEVGVGGINLFGEYYTTINYQDKVDKTFSFVVQFSSIGIAGINPITYEVYTWLFKNHFDVFGLIDRGLAIDKYEVDSIDVFNKK